MNVPGFTTDVYFVQKINSVFIGNTLSFKSKNAQPESILWSMYCGVNFYLSLLFDSDGRDSLIRTTELVKIVSFPSVERSSKQFYFTLLES